jgi:hypothetical protein
MYDGRPVLLGFSPLGNLFRRREWISPSNFERQEVYELLGPDSILFIHFAASERETVLDAYRALCIEEAIRYR